MNRPALNVSLTYTSFSELRGSVTDDLSENASVRMGTDVTIFINPEKTAFRDPNILGNGRIYDDRIEIDLLLAPDPALSLVQSLNDSAAPQVCFTTRPITESIFRIETVQIG